ncbi:hypothetical protein [Modestobacter sp. DSM 44400]|uniref:hypothetical protein n=1 Tax=Modestobacter sp. DSM 44400 TaxID=1550230 RepID=UPI0011153263|nr:hypothetical protein [Modestobacter sp. DSM 44400]
MLDTAPQAFALRSRRTRVASGNVSDDGGDHTFLPARPDRRRSRTAPAGRLLFRPGRRCGRRDGVGGRQHPRERPERDGRGVVVSRSVLVADVTGTGEVIALAGDGR